MVPCCRRGLSISNVNVVSVIPSKLRPTSGSTAGRTDPAIQKRVLATSASFQNDEEVTIDCPVSHGRMKVETEEEMVILATGEDGGQGRKGDRGISRPKNLILFKSRS